MISQAREMPITLNDWVIISGTFAGIVALFAVPLIMYLKERQENKFNKKLGEIREKIQLKETEITALKETIKLKEEQIKEIKSQVEEWIKRATLLEEKAKLIEEGKKKELEKLHKELEERRRAYEELVERSRPNVLPLEFKTERRLIKAGALFSPAEYADETLLVISNEGNGKALYVHVTCTPNNPETGWRMRPLYWPISEIAPGKKVILNCGELQKYPYKILSLQIVYEDIYGKNYQHGPRDWKRQA